MAVVTDLIDHRTTMRMAAGRSRAVRDRILELSNYVVSGYMNDPAAARGQVLMALGQTIEQQPVIAANSDMLVALGVMLLAVSWLVLFARKGVLPPVGLRRPTGWRTVSDDRGATFARRYTTAAVTYPAAVFLNDRASTAGCELRERARDGLQNRG
jgi:hypothetical protein